MKMNHTRQLFWIASLVILCSCQREESPISAKRHTINASLSTSTKTILEEQDGSFDLLTKWQGHEYIKVFVMTDGEYNETARSVQVSEVTTDGSGATFSYRVPDEWGDSDFYEVKMFTSTCRPAIKDNKLYYNASIIREPISTFQVPVYAEGEIGSEGTLSTVFHHYYTYELLHIANTSDSAIEFSLLGFEGAPWFKEKGSICIDDGSFVIDAPSTQNPRRESNAISIQPGETQIIVSAYIPNGFTIHEARMVTLINGEYVHSSNTKSSGIELKQGHAYHMYAGWNGEALEFWKDGEIPLYVKTLTASVDPNTIYGSFTGTVTNAPLDGLETGFRFWKEGNHIEDYVEYDATSSSDGAFGLDLTFDDFVYIAGDAPVKGTYNVSAFVLDTKGDRYHGNTLQFTIDKDQPDIPTEPTTGDLIDMGLSVLWASCNTGASSPQETGGFYAWGETSTKSSYDWSNYQWSNGSENSLKKYCTQVTYGIVDNRITLEPSDDAAYVNSQGTMRMPTSAEWQDLLDKCQRIKTSYKGRDGYLFYSPATGNTVFIPVGGYFGKSGLNNSDLPYYWSSDLRSDAPINAISFHGREVLKWNRSEGLSVRPVADGIIAPVIPVESVVLDKTELELIVGETSTLTATVLPKNATNKEVTWSIDKESVATVSSTGVVTATAPGSAVITVTTSDGGKTASCNVTVEYVSQPTMVPDIIDLGLSVKWASFNLGATKPEEFGDYYAWGETEPYYISLDPLIWKPGKEKGYASASYKWITDSKLTKYCTNRAYGYKSFVDDKTVLEPEDDAAYVALGAGWRMPTREDMDELWGECTWEWSSRNGVDGYTVTGPNGKSIFLPLPGFRISTSDNYVNSRGFYWLSSLYEGYPDRGQVLTIDSDKVSGYSIVFEYRYLGLSIRPVYGAPPVPVESVSLNKTEFEILVGETSSITATVLPQDATNKGVTWSSSNESVATVSSSGAVTGRSAGSAVITATTVDGGKTANCNVTVKDVSHSGNDTEMVDLGLSVMWASVNLGATTQEEYGDYYAWGETEPYYNSQSPLTWKTGKESGYDWPSYKWCMGSYRTLTKYCTDSYYGYNDYMDGETVLDLEDDAAHVNLGGKWRMPTKEEINELWDKCTVKWTTINGVKGEQITGPTGNSIFLPAAGRRVNSYVSCAGTAGYYWTSTLDDSPSDGFYRIFYTGNVYWESDGRPRGQSIRPVYGEYTTHVKSVTLNKTELDLMAGESSTLVETVFPENANDKSVFWSSSNESVATVSSNGVVTGVGAGYAVISVTTNDREKTATCSVTVKKPLSPIITPQIVDLGLSVKWASFNLGASKPEEYGRYYAWGETETYYSYLEPLIWKPGKEAGYDWASYKWCIPDGFWGPLTKYCTNPDYGEDGFTDGKAVLEAEDDAAHVNLGGKWRMPTKEELDELLEKCSWERTSENGVSGYKFTGPNGKSIFMPTAGSWNGTNLSGASKNTAYWSSSVNTKDPANAYNLYFTTYSPGSSSNSRTGGFVIRPVYAD